MTPTADETDGSVRRESTGESSSSLAGSAENTPDSRRTQDAPTTKESEPINLYVRGVAPQASNEEVEAAFKKFGKIVSCSIVRDPYSKECRGFGFVKLASIEAAEEAMNPEIIIEVCGRRLNVERAKRNGPHEKTPGQYLGIDKSVRERYTGYKRAHYDPDQRHGRGGPYADFDRRGPGGRFERRDPGRFDPRDGERGRFQKRRRYSPDRSDLDRPGGYSRSRPWRDYDGPRDMGFRSDRPSRRQLSPDHHKSRAFDMREGGREERKYETTERR